MSDINHFAISSILGSEIVGGRKFGHGQIGSLGDAQRYFDTLAVTESPDILHRNEEVDFQKVIEAFHAVRNERGDRGSPDLYVADPERNAQFIAKCRELGLQCSDYLINKRLMNARKDGLLPGLRSAKTRSGNYEDYAFACEFAATELKYKIGASIDDIICDPGVSARFDSIVRKLAPRHTSFEYRWAILSIRKAGRKAKWKSEDRLPGLTGQFRLVADPIDAIPDERGLYLLSENGKKPLYARSTEHLRHAIGIHRMPEFTSAILDKLWKPNPESFLVNYAVLPTGRSLKAFEKKLIEERKPIFNVPRKAA